MQWMCLGNHAADALAKHETRHLVFFIREFTSMNYIVSVLLNILTCVHKYVCVYPSKKMCVCVCVCVRSCVWLRASQKEKKDALNRFKHSIQLLRKKIRTNSNILLGSFITFLILII